MRAHSVAFFLRAVLVAALVSAPRSAASQEPQRLASPDGALQARILPIRRGGFDTIESRVEIRSARGALRRFLSLGSYDGEHGFGVHRVAWTSDGRYCVFSVWSSGGHSVWHQPVYVYLRARNRFLRLDDYVGPVMSDFEVLEADRIRVRRMNLGSGAQDEEVIVRLSRIEKRRA